MTTERPTLRARPATRRGVLVSLCLAGVLALTGFARTPPADKPPERTTFVIVRHAEKEADGTRDPDLTDAGRDRARRLADMLASMDVAGVYATPFKRTQRTGEPTADRFGLGGVGSYDPRSGPDELERLAAAHAGRVIVVVGHSNTVPDLVRALGADPGVREIDESEYDRLYLVTTVQGGSPVCHLLRF